jgi:hypothetical protein
MGRPPAIWAGLRKRQQTASEEAKEIAWKAQHRLHKRYARLAAKGKDKRKIVTAVGRELLGFIWAIGTRTEANAAQRVAAWGKAKARTFPKNEKTKATNRWIATHNSRTEPAAAEASTKENPRLSYATGSAGLAITVRGCSRRIMVLCTAWEKFAADWWPTMPTYLRRRERSWFRSANEVLKRLPTWRFGIYR